MGQFLIRPDYHTISVQDLSERGNNLLRDSLQQAVSESKLFGILKRHTFSGTGTCRIVSRSYSVSFKDVKITTDANQHARADQGTATVVRSQEHDTLKYVVDDCKIRIPPRSIILNPDKATCNAFVDVSAFFAANLNTLTFEGQQAILSGDGSICGTDFACDNQFLPRESPFQIDLTSDVHDTIALGNDTEHQYLNRGIRFSASSSEDLIRFVVKGEILDKTKFCRLDYTLDQPTCDLTPECGYDINVKRGTITYLYNLIFAPVRSSGIEILNGNRSTIARLFSTITHDNLGNALTRAETEVSISSSLIADVSLPEIVQPISGGRISLSDIVLQVDTDGALFGKAPIPPFWVGSTYKIECSDTNGWLYFPSWWLKCDPPMHQCGTCSDSLLTDLYRCQKYILPCLRRIDPLHRSGATVLEGNLSFVPPQLQGGTLHTRFFGALTMTNWGVSGSLTSGGYSVVPRGMPDTMLFVSPVNNSLVTVMRAGNAKPPQITPLFQLDSFQIRDMVIDSIVFCSSKISASCVKYMVHFPWPSYIDVTFRDNTLDDAGRFSEARGPLQASSGGNALGQSWHYMSNLVMTPKGDLPRGAPQVLWFWRLPVTFDADSVVLKYNESNVKVKSGTTEILPLNSASRNVPGILFKALMTRNGSFSFSELERKDSLGRWQAKNFYVELDTVILAGDRTNPVTRKWDYQWSGTVKLPFFGNTHMNFIVKNDTLESNVVCQLEDFVSLNSSGSCNLTLTVNAKVQFDYPTGKFSGNGPSYSYGQGTLYGKTLDINSYTNAFLRLSVGGKDTCLSHSVSTTTTDLCNTNDTTEQHLYNWTQDDIDLVSYDIDARTQRGDPAGSCGRRFLRGLYKVLSIVGTDTTVVFSADLATYYYMDPKSFDFTNARCETRSKDPAAKPMSFHIPGATLLVDDGTIAGAFHISIASDESSPLSAEVDVEFYLNTTCHYFFFYGNAEFQYYIGFGGQVFFCRAPYCVITGDCLQLQGFPSPFQKMADFSICEDECANTLKILMFGRDISSSDVVTGFALGGDVKFSVGIFDLEMGATVFYFKTDNDHVGAQLFAAGRLDLIVAEAVVSANLTGVKTPSEFILYGELYGCACMSAWVGHLQASFETSATYSTTDGLNFASPSLDFEAGWGGCTCR
jgi:hypothetical protein